MIGTPASRALLTVVGCVLLASCGTAKPSTAPAGANPATSSVATPAASSLATPVASSGAVTPAASSVAVTPAAAAAAVNAGGNGMTACGLITEQDASAALGSAAGRGTPGGTAALSECIYADGALLVSMKTDSKAIYDQSLAGAKAKGLPNLPGIGDSAFKSGTDKFCALLFIKGTTLVSILLGASDAQDRAVAVAKVAASKL
jgi:hypothetical protein